MQTMKRCRSKALNGVPRHKNNGHRNNNMSEHIWIYHERQQALLCGQHALNNLVQACNFSPESLAEIAHQLDEMELQFMSQNNEGGIHSKEYLARVAEVRLRLIRRS